MPASKIGDVLANKPVTFNIKTSGGEWKCQIHTNRAAYERTRVTEATTAIPGIARTDSGLSTTSTASTSSAASSSSSTSSH